MGLLLGEDVLHIPVPAPVMARWRAAAEVAGYPLDQWVAQRVEAYLEAVHTFAPLDTGADTVDPARAEKFTQCGKCTTPKSCRIGRQDTEACE